MKRASEPDCSDDPPVEKIVKSEITSEESGSLNLEQDSLSEDVLELSPECTVEISHDEESEANLMHDDSNSLVYDGEGAFETLVEFMDITEPLNNLRTLLERKTGRNLGDFQFYLQSSQELDATKNLVNQCVQGEGMVQINVEIIDKDGLKKLNILDVLKPAEEIPISSNVNAEGLPRIFLLGDSTYVEAAGQSTSKEATGDSQQITKWVMSPDFRRLQERFKVPHDPAQWSEENVKLWLEWATSHFKISKVGIRDWRLAGKELMEIDVDDFKVKMRCGVPELFWTHLELLRKFKIVAVVHPNESNDKKGIRRVPRIGPPKIPYEGSPGNHTGSNGQIQLWQFLLELLTDKDYRDYIQWVDNGGEFKLINPEVVAQLWGQRKNKPTMNYEKLSRALRYYYDGEMLAKVHGKRFVYKFVCDLKSLLGYDAYELNRLVKQCEEKANNTHAAVEYVQPIMYNQNS